MSDAAPAPSPGVGNEPLLHIIRAADWQAAQAAGRYTPAALETDGFIHLSATARVLRVADHNYAGQTDLLLLVLDPARLRAPVRWERSADTGWEAFPHLYGPLNLDAVVQVLPFPVGAQGFVLPAALARREPLLVFFSGSINSGKSATSRLLAERLDARWLDCDALTARIPDFSLASDLDRVLDLAVVEINASLREGESVVANYVLREQDYARLSVEIQTERQHYFTLAPRLEVAQRQRGERVLSDWERERIAHHYASGINLPSFGEVIDNSDLSLGETVALALDRIRSDAPASAV